jgi:hypothetical protein
LTIGDYVYIQAHTTNSSFQIRNIVGNVITLDTPSWQHFPIGTEVRKYTPLIDFHIIGGTWQGEFLGTPVDSRVFFASAAWNCSWEQIRNTITGLGPQYIYGFDFAGRNNLIAGCTNQNNPLSLSGKFSFLEGQIGSTLRDCIGYDTGGMDWNRGGNSCFSFNNRMYNASVGMTLVNDEVVPGGIGVNGLQSDGLYVHLAPGGVGIYLWYRAHDNHFVNTVIVSSDSSQGAAIRLDEGAAPGDGPSNNTFENLTVRGVKYLCRSNWSATGNVIKNVEINDVFSLCEQGSAADEIKMYNVRGNLRTNGFSDFNMQSIGGRIELCDSNLVVGDSVAFAAVNGVNGVVVLRNSTIIRSPADTGYLFQASSSGARVQASDVIASGFSNGILLSGAGAILSLSGRNVFDGPTSVVSGGGLVTLQQLGGTLIFNESNRFLLLGEMQNTVIEVPSGSIATAIGIPNVSGLSVVIRNDSGHPLQVVSTAGGDTGVTIASGFSQSVRVNSTGHCVANAAAIG